MSEDALEDWERLDALQEAIIKFGSGAGESVCFKRIVPNSDPSWIEMYAVSRSRDNTLEKRISEGFTIDECLDKLGEAQEQEKRLLSMANQVGRMLEKEKKEGLEA